MPKRLNVFIFYYYNFFIDTFAHVQFELLHTTEKDNVQKVVHTKTVSAYTTH